VVEADIGQPFQFPDSKNSAHGVQDPPAMHRNVSLAEKL